MARRSLRALHWNESLHPRDDRGRFSKKGSPKWFAQALKRTAGSFGDISMGAAPGHEPRNGRAPHGVIDIGAARRASQAVISHREQGPGRAPTGKIPDLGKTAKVGRTPVGQQQAEGGAGVKATTRVIHDLIAELEKNHPRTTKPTSTWSGQRPALTESLRHIAAQHEAGKMSKVDAHNALLSMSIEAHLSSHQPVISAAAKRFKAAAPRRPGEPTVAQRRLKAQLQANAEGPGGLLRAEDAGSKAEGATKKLTPGQETQRGEKPPMVERMRTLSTQMRASRDAANASRMEAAATAMERGDTRQALLHTGLVSRTEGPFQSHAQALHKDLRKAAGDTGGGRLNRAQAADKGIITQYDEMRAEERRLAAHRPTAEKARAFFNNVMTHLGANPKTMDASQEKVLETFQKLHANADEKMISKNVDQAVAKIMQKVEQDSGDKFYGLGAYVRTELENEVRSGLMGEDQPRPVLDKVLAHGSVDDLLALTRDMRAERAAAKKAASVKKAADTRAANKAAKEAKSAGPNVNANGGNFAEDLKKELGAGDQLARKTAPKVASRNREPARSTEGVVRNLRESVQTRDAGYAELDGLTTAELRDVARQLNVRRDGATKQDLKDRIVERAVGSRLNSQVLRENGPDFGRAGSKPSEERAVRAKMNSGAGIQGLTDAELQTALNDPNLHDTTKQRIAEEIARRANANLPTGVTAAQAARIRGMSTEQLQANIAKLGTASPLGQYAATVLRSRGKA